MSERPASLTSPPQGYAEWLAELKHRIHAAQQRATLAVNRELVLLYWQIGRDILQRQSAQNALALVENPGVGKAFLEMTQRLMTDPVKLMEAQVGLWTQYVSLWQQGATAMLGNRAVEPVVRPARSDKRFKHEDWEHNALFD